MRVTNSPTKPWVTRTVETASTRAAERREREPEKKSFFDRAREAAETARSYRQPSVTRTAHERLAALEPGDTLTIAGEAKVKVGTKVELRAEVTVKRSSTGEYTMEAAADGVVGVALLGEVQVGAGGSLEFSFDSLEAAQRGLEALLPFGRGSLDDLNGHLRGVALSAEVCAKLEAKMGLGFATAGVEVKGKADLEYALRFEPDGVRLERTHSISGKVEGEFKLGTAFGEVEGEFVPGRDTTKASVAITSVMKLPDHLGNTDVLKALAFVGDLTGLSNRALDAQTDLTITWDHELRAAKNERGHQVKLSAEQVSASEIARSIPQVFRGDARAVANTLGEVSISHQQFEDHGLDWELDVGLPGFGVEVRAQHETRDFEPVEPATSNS